MSTLLYNGVIVNQDQAFEGWIHLDGEIIVSMGQGVPDVSTYGPDVTVVDCEGDLLIPGVIDTHVHFRDPGLTAKGDISSESRAAVAGGVTSYIDMPNTKPATVTHEAWQEKMNRARYHSVANYAFFLGATNDNLDTLLEADYTRVPGIKLFLGSSTGNMLVDDDSMLHKLFAQAPAIIAVHAEDESTIRHNRAEIESEYPQGDVPVSLHNRLRDDEACFKASQHAVNLAREYNTRLHLLHVSTARELNLLKAGDIGSKRITAETCPHYLLFTGDMLDNSGARLKCNPAIKTAADRDALSAALVDGRIDTIATDHAPHQLVDKEGDLFHAASGMPGVQFSLVVMLSLGYDPRLVVKLMCHNPSRLFGIVERGYLLPGYKADIVRVGKYETPHVIDDDDVKSLCGWTPYAGVAIDHYVKSTWVNGHLAYDGGHIVESNVNGEPLRFQP